MKFCNGKIAELLHRGGLHGQADQEVRRKKRTVNIEPLGDGTAVLKNLAPYVNRIAISDKRFTACDHRTVTFRFTLTGKKRSVIKTVTGNEFVRDFVQHTLPPGFRKVRYYGWMSPNSRIRLEEFRRLVWLMLGLTFWLASMQRREQEPPRAGQCCDAYGGTMHVVPITDHRSL